MCGSMSDASIQSTAEVFDRHDWDMELLCLVILLSRCLVAVLMLRKLSMLKSVVQCL